MDREVVIGASVDNTIRRQRDTSRVGAIKGGQKEVILIVCHTVARSVSGKLKLRRCK